MFLYQHFRIQAHQAQHLVDRMKCINDARPFGFNRKRVYVLIELRSALKTCLTFSDAVYTQRIWAQQNPINSILARVGFSSINLLMLCAKRINSCRSGKEGILLFLKNKDTEKLISFRSPKSHLHAGTKQKCSKFFNENSIYMQKSHNRIWIENVFSALSDERRKQPRNSNKVKKNNNHQTNMEIIETNVR